MSKVINVGIVSGGACHGVVQLGVLSCLLRNKEIRFDILSGTSVGSQISATLAMGSTAQEQLKYLDLLRERFFAIKSPDDIYLRRGLAKIFPWGGLIEDAVGSLGSDSIYDSSPLKDMIFKNIDPEKIRSSGVELRVGVVNLMTGEFAAIKQDNPYLREFVLASSSIPVILNPIEIGGYLYSDGGVKAFLPLEPACEALESMYEDGDEVNVYLIYSSAPNPVVKAKSELSDFTSILLRSIDLLASEVARDDILESAKCRFKEINANVTVFQPKKDVLSSLDFFPKKIKEGYDYGYTLAEEVLGIR